MSLFRRPKHLVRLHHARMDQSLEGILIGVMAGHYVLRTPKIVTGEDDSYALDGNEVRVPAENVLFYEVLR